jgi:hypothetical protein
MKNLNDTIHICRRQRLLTSMFRAPELSKYDFFLMFIINRLIDLDLNSNVCGSIGKVFIREINAINLPFISIQKNG